MTRTVWLAATLMPTSALADDFFVTSTNDTCASPVPLCTSSGTGTWSCTELRHAFAHINSIGSGSHSIRLPNGTITFDPTGPGSWLPGLEDNNECGDMDLTAAANVTLLGHVGAGSVLDANGGSPGPGTEDRALDFHAGTASLINFQIRGGNATIGYAARDTAYPNYGGGAVRSAVQLSLEGMRIWDNDLECLYPLNDDGGGAVYTSAMLTVYDSEIFENSAQECAGGGIHSRGGLTMEDSEMRQNLAYSGGYGGAIALSGGVASSIVGSTITNNTASAAGGGVYVYGGGTTLSMDASVLDNNLVNWIVPTCTSCPTGGGALALHDASSADLFNTTVSTNNVSASVGAPAPVGGAIWVAPSATIAAGFNTIADNALLGADDGLHCAGTCTVLDSIAEDACTTPGTLTWGTGNVDAAAGTCSGGPSVAPFLGALASYGSSPTRTHAHAPGSPADGAATSSNCPSTDQRGVSRGVPCDAGAHEEP